ncbi:MAG TPA: riboflavin biosynthesis protein RibF [bacterium]|nr:riboflavin biosynthesis protein RibF [bacterium]
MILVRSPRELADWSGPLAVSVGVFDGVHRGHRAVFEALAAEARSRGGENGPVRRLVVTLDPHPVVVLRPNARVPLLTTPRERARLLEGPDAPDGFLVHTFDREVAALPPAEFLRGLVPPGCRLAALVVGYDFRMGKDRSGGFEELSAMGARDGFTVVRVPPAEVDGAPISSTRIRDLVAAGRMPEATELLGRPYRLVGTVVSGRGVGRTLDFPTANVDVGDDRKLLPEFGVYAVRVRILGDESRGERRPGVLNRGVRPTFGLSDPVVEVHLPGFEGDLTGRELDVEVVERIRSEERFSSPQELAARIAVDVQEARRILQERP